MYLSVILNVMVSMRVTNSRVNFPFTHISINIFSSCGRNVSKSNIIVLANVPPEIVLVLSEELGTMPCLLEDFVAFVCLMYWNGRKGDWSEFCHIV